MVTLLMPLVRTPMSSQRGLPFEHPEAKIQRDGEQAVADGVRGIGNWPGNDVRELFVES
jgi:hypothetical protein